MCGSRPAATLLLDAKWGARRSLRAGAHGGEGVGRPWGRGGARSRSPAGAAEPGTTRRGPSQPRSSECAATEPCPRRVRAAEGPGRPRAEPLWGRASYVPHRASCSPRVPRTSTRETECQGPWPHGACPPRPAPRQSPTFRPHAASPRASNKKQGSQCEGKESSTISPSDGVQPNATPQLSSEKQGRC